MGSYYCTHTHTSTIQNTKHSYFPFPQKISKVYLNDRVFSSTIDLNPTNIWLPLSIVGVCTRNAATFYQTQWLHVLWVLLRVMLPSAPTYIDCVSRQHYCYHHHHHTTHTSAWVANRGNLLHTQSMDSTQSILWWKMDRNHRAMRNATVNYHVRLDL